MAIRQRGDRWLVDVSRKGRRLTATCRNKAGAQVREAELRIDLQRAPEPEGWTLAIAFHHCHSVVWAHTASDLPMHHMKKHLYMGFGPGTALKDITTSRVDAWTAELRAGGNSGATINRKCAALGRVLSFAASRGDVSGYRHEQRPDFRKQKESPGRIRQVSDEEEGKLLDLAAHWHEYDFYDAIVVLVDTGMRTGELWRMEARDLNFTDGLIDIWVTKANQPRSVPMTDRVRAILGRRRDHANDPRVFPYSNAWVRQRWERARFMMTLEADADFVPHILRHTCACRLVQRGVSLEVVRDWLGHKSITMTMRYARLTPRNLLDAVKVLNPPTGDSE